MKHCNSGRHLIIFTLGCCFTIGFYFFSYTINSYSFFTDYIYDDNSDVTYVNLPSDVDIFLKWCQHWGLELILLDKNVLLCLSNATQCAATKDLNLSVFGVFEEKLKNLQNLITFLKNKKWTVTNYNRHYLFHKNGVKIVILFIENRKNYWYFSKFPAADIEEFAIQKPENLSKIDLNRVSKILIPTPINKTLRRLENSKFINCNESSAKFLKKHYAYLYNVALINEKHLEAMAYMRDILQDIGIYPFLFGGTALGWYRECGVIPYTTDLDMAAFSSEYSKKLDNILKKNQRLKLYWILGMPNDSLEITVYSDKMKIDLFMIYENDSNAWAGGMIVTKKEKLKWIYPKIDGLCTADLNGHLFNVACNVVQLIEADYGENWYRPKHESNFLWHSSHMNVVYDGFWTAEQWPTVFRTFDTTLTYIKAIR